MSKKRPAPEDFSDDCFSFGEEEQPSPKFVPGLVDSLPTDAGPWLKKCVAQWQLIAPFDLSVTEEQWEEYYKERAALHWFNNETNGLHCENIWDSYSPEEHVEPKWSENFPQPPLKAYNAGKCYSDGDVVEDHIKMLRKSIKDVISGCSKLTSKLTTATEDKSEIAVKLASGIYILFGETEWHVDGDSCESLEIQTRLYSPFGLGTSIDMSVAWHLRQGYTIQHYLNLCFALRTAAECQHTEPQYTICTDQGKIDKNRVIEMYSTSLADYTSDYYKRKLGSTSKLQAAEMALFGRENVLSDRKMFSLLAHAGLGVDIHEIKGDLRWMLKVSRREWKKFDDETGDGSDGDVDSDNEGKRQKMEARKYRNHQIIEKKKKRGEWGWMADATYDSDVSLEDDWDSDDDEDEDEEDDSDSEL
jgi:hypothetical protein